MPARDSRNPDGLIRLFESRISEAEDAEASRRKGWGAAKTLAEATVQGKARLTLDEVCTRLMPALISAGVQEEAARKALTTGWRAGEGETPRQAPQREVQAAVAAAPRPAGVHELREVVLAVLAVPLVKNKVFALILDALDVHTTATRGAKDEPRGAA
jgi:hypothetical protein